MEKAPNKFMSVVYELYTIADGKETLEEQTGEERPFEFFTNCGDFAQIECRREIRRNRISRYLE